MSGKFFLFTFILFWCRHVLSKKDEVPMVWNQVGTGCFQYDFYYMVEAKTKAKCLKKCEDDVKCALVAYYEKKRKCALCSEGYKPKTSCPYPVELVVKDVDECAGNSHNCGENAVCENTLGSFNCHCKPGFYKNSEKKCIKVPLVKWISHQDKCYKARSSFAKFEVPSAEECKQKCVLSPSRCLLVEYRPLTKKCALSKHRKFKKRNFCQSRIDVFLKAIVECDDERPCPKHAHCRTKKRNRVCVCRFGYRGNGKICKDIDECNTFTSLCGQHAECKNTLGSYKCVCLPGYQGDGQSCRKDKPKLDEEDTALLEKTKKSGAIQTIINLFSNSASRYNSSQLLAFLTLLSSIVVSLYR